MAPHFDGPPTPGTKPPRKPMRQGRLMTRDELIESFNKPGGFQWVTVGQLNLCKLTDGDDGWILYVGSITPETERIHGGNRHFYTWRRIGNTVDGTRRLPPLEGEAKTIEEAQLRAIEDLLRVPHNDQTQTGQIDGTADESPTTTTTMRPEPVTGETDG